MHPWLNFCLIHLILQLLYFFSLMAENILKDSRPSYIYYLLYLHFKTKQKHFYEHSYQASCLSGLLGKDVPCKYIVSTKLTPNGYWFEFNKSQGSFTFQEFSHWEKKFILNRLTESMCVSETHSGWFISSISCVYTLMHLCKHTYSVLK